jgi:hypothetical protein
MRVNQSEIIDDVLQHIQKCGGDLSEWWVGTAGMIQDGRFKIQDAGFKIQDSRCGIQDSRCGIQDATESENKAEAGMPKLVYREAYTPYAADGVIDYLTGLGLRRDPHSTRGCFVFLYRPAAAQRASSADLFVRSAAFSSGQGKGPQPL